MMRHRWLIALAAIATVFIYVSADHADARAGGGSSGGSRGSRSFSAPPATRTAPNTAAPLQRSTTLPGAATTGAAGAAARPGLFGGGMLGGLAAGFIGAGLFGMLFGHGMFGGMGGFASMIGLLLQVGLVIIVARLAFAWWQRRNGASSYATQAASPAQGRASGATTSAFGGLGSMFGGNAQSAPAGEPVTLDRADYDAFEQLLTEVQEAYSAEDLAALRGKATPEMVSYFAEELADHASRGVINRVTDVKLLQGDLSEAWHEGAHDYATVAMHFGLVDTTVERASGRTVEGGQPSEVTELWTFMRTRGGMWLLSAIQQA